MPPLTGSLRGSIITTRKRRIPPSWDRKLAIFGPNSALSNSQSPKLPDPSSSTCLVNLLSQQPVYSSHAGVIRRQVPRGDELVASEEPAWGVHKELTRGLDDTDNIISTMPIGLSTGIYRNVARARCASIQP